MRLYNVTLPLAVTKNNLSTFALSFFDHSDDIISRSSGEKSAQLDFGEVCEVSGLDGRHSLLDERNEFFRSTALDDDTLRRHASLPREEDGTRDDSTGSIFEISVFENL